VKINKLPSQQYSKYFTRDQCVYKETTNYQEKNLLVLYRKIVLRMYWKYSYLTLVILV